MSARGEFRPLTDEDRRWFSYPNARLIRRDDWETIVVCDDCVVTVWEPEGEDGQSVADFVYLEGSTRREPWGET